MARDLCNANVEERGRNNGNPSDPCHAGVNQKKHNALHEEGNLELQIRPMAYKGASIAWMRSLSMSQQEDWSEELPIPDGPMATKKQLKQMACPKCSHMKNTDV